MSIDCRESSWPLSVIVNSGEMVQRKKSPGEEGEMNLCEEPGRTLWWFVECQGCLPKKVWTVPSVLEARCGADLQSILLYFCGRLDSLAEMTWTLWISEIQGGSMLPLPIPQSTWVTGHWVVLTTASPSYISLGPLPLGLCPLKSSLLCRVKTSTTLPWSVICIYKQIYMLYVGLQLV